MHTTVRKVASDVRVVWLKYFFILCFGALCLQLLKIQVAEHAKYKFAAKQQQWGQYEIPAIRGEIYSSDMHLLAGTQDYFLLYGEPQKISNTVEVANKLADYFVDDALANVVTETTPSDPKFKSDLRNAYFNRYVDALSKDLLWVALEHRVSPKARDELTAMNLEGIGFEIEPIRYYPEKTLASHLLGFVASDERGENQGYFGVEGSFNEDLKGRKGRVSEEVDANGIPLLVGDSKKTPAIKGSTIVLTIDRSVQFIVEQKLKAGVEKYDAKSGTVIVMDPFDGSIIAMANYPTYSPSNFNDDPELKEEDYRKKIERRNYAIAETYEPGSIVKPLTVAAAIDLGIVNENTTFDDAGPVNYSGAWINNWDGKHYGIQTITQLLQKSNNIGAAWTGHQIGSKKLYEYLSNFGLGSRSNIELEGEDSGILRDHKTWTDIDLANISFGQGMSTTPLQMLNAINVLANGGFLMQPRIIQRVDDNGRVLETPPKIIRRVITKQTSENMVDLLEKAAAGGEAKYYILKNFRISGKTGTAQIPIEGKYDPDKTNASFVGFLTGSKKYSMIVKLEQPRASIFAAETAVPLWMDITAELIKYYGIVPDKEVE
jgi:stage V sporulation protein D (sporulation-specific penicillin-binding protein)